MMQLSKTTYGFDIPFLDQGIITCDEKKLVIIANTLADTDQKIKLTFTNIYSFRCVDDFYYLNETAEKVVGKGAMLLIEDSAYKNWFIELGNHTMAEQDVFHYFVQMENYDVDVLSPTKPRVEFLRHKRSMQSMGSE